MPDRRIDYLSVENSNCLKGLLAVCVGACHINAKLIETRSGIWNSFNIIFFAMGYLSVAVFFFLSGYGMMAQYRKKGQKYIREFPRYRVLPFYIGCFLLVCIYSIYKIVNNQEITVDLFLSSLLFGDTVVIYGWYLQTIVVMYLLFFLSFSLKKTDNQKVWILACSILLYCIYCYFADFPITRYESVLCIILGMLWYDKKTYIDKFFEKRKNYIYGIIIAFALFCVFFVLRNSGSRNAIIKFVFNTTLCLVFSVFVLLLIMKIPINNFMSKKLGIISYEIYVTQGLVLDVFRSNIVYISNNYLYVLLCVLGTIVFSVLLHIAFDFINKMVRKQNNRIKA